MPPLAFVPLLMDIYVTILTFSDFATQIMFISTLFWESLETSRSHGSVRVVRTTSSQWEMLKFDPQTTHEPLKRSSPNLACMITSWIPSTKKNLGSSPHMREIYTQMFATLRMFTTFFGSSNRLEPRHLHGF